MSFFEQDINKSVNLKSPGTYILLLELKRKSSDIKIGRKLEVSLEPGLYSYVGSALGPGGLVTRLRRHASKSSIKHWHIDYLLPYTKIIGALVIPVYYASMFTNLAAL